MSNLRDLGISRDPSSRWQKVAAIPEPQFEQTIAASRERQEELTTSAVLRANKNGDGRAKEGL
jgi:hypothetical protein